MDRFVIPQRYRHFYTESLVYMPWNYHPWLHAHTYGLQVDLRLVAGLGLGCEIYLILFQKRGKFSLVQVKHSSLGVSVELADLVK